MSEVVTEREVIFERVSEIADRFERVLKDCAPILLPPTMKEERVRELLGVDDSRPNWAAFRILVLLEPLIGFLESEIVPVVKETPAEQLRGLGRKRAPDGKFTKGH